MYARRTVQELRSKAIANENEVNFPFITPFSDVITREQLYRICRTNDLHTVKHLEVALDLNRTPVHHLLEQLPSLCQLVLTTHGPMASIRELGINAKNLTTIHISNSGIQDLDGISSLSSVVELRLSNNRINDLSPLALHDTLEILDLSRNLVDELVSCESLGTCRRLTSLDLTDNPVSQKTECFRSIICQWIPQVSELTSVAIMKNCKEWKSLAMSKTFFVSGQLQILDGKEVQPANQEISLLCVEDAYRILPIEPEGSCSTQSPRGRVVKHETELSSKQDEVLYGSFAMAGNVARSILRMKIEDTSRIQDGYI